VDLGIAGRVALIGASGRGLGLATAKRLSMEGVHVAICDKDEEVLDLARESVLSMAVGGKVTAYHVDLTCANDIQRLVENVHKDLGLVSILVTNSGGPPPGSFDDADDEKWELGYGDELLTSLQGH